ncbi:MAG: hypothetical protein ACFFB3_15745 [Candidatus Hodarchaeota archaeon]
MTDLLYDLFVLFAMFLGLLASYFLPYWRKHGLGDIDKMDWNYLIRLFISTFWEFLAGLAVYSEWKPPDEGISLYIVLLLAFAFGYGGHEAQKEAEKYLLYRYRKSKSQ